MQLGFNICSCVFVFALNMSHCIIFLIRSHLTQITLKMSNFVVNAFYVSDHMAGLRTFLLAIWTPLEICPQMHSFYMDLQRSDLCKTFAACVAEIFVVPFILIRAFWLSVNVCYWTRQYRSRPCCCTFLKGFSAWFGAGNWCDFYIWYMWIFNGSW